MQDADMDKEDWERANSNRAGEAMDTVTKLEQSSKPFGKRTVIGLYAAFPCVTAFQCT